MNVRIHILIISAVKNIHTIECLTLIEATTFYSGFKGEDGLGNFCEICNTAENIPRQNQVLLLRRTVLYAG